MAQGGQGAAPRAPQMALRAGRAGPSDGQTAPLLALLDLREPTWRSLGIALFSLPCIQSFGYLQRAAYWCLTVRLSVVWVCVCVWGVCVCECVWVCVCMYVCMFAGS